MKTNHHGAYTSNCEEWLTTLSPLIAFSTSDDIGGSVLAEQLPAMGTTYYSAGTDGLILVTMDNNKNYDVISQYDTILRRGYTGTIGKVVSEEEQKPGGGDASTGGDTSIGGDASTGKDASIGGNVATGDASRPLLWLGLMSACGAALLFLLLRRRRENLL